MGGWVWGDNWYQVAPGLAGCRSPYPSHTEFKRFRHQVNVAMATQFDWDEYIQSVWRAVVYISRYLGSGLNEVIEWDLSRVMRVAGLTGDLVSKENGPEAGA